jgi:energy-coupling factor transport system ATP-binding protein
MDSIINLENVSYSYPGAKKKALDGVTLSVRGGEFLAVIGENGAGKTTFCKLLNGIIPHGCGGSLSGTVTVDGERTESSSVPRLALKTGMVLDDPDAQIFTSSVRHEAAFGPENLLLPPDEIEERVKFALGAVGLDGFEDRKPATLSGGEKQRLAIAASLAMNGKILVLDEPLCRLDPEGEAGVISVLKELKEKKNITVIMTANDGGKIPDFTDRVCVLKNGLVAACGTAEKILADRALLDDCGIWPLDNKRVRAEAQRHEEHKEERGAAVEISNLSFSYEGAESCLEGVNLTIFDNDFAAVVGRNGCGKTTLLKIVTGLLRPVSGEVFVRGKNTKGLAVGDISKEIGFVMQNPDNQLFTDSVYNEVAFALKNARLPGAEIRRRALEALETVGLQEHDAFPHALSRADRAKTVIACVLAMGCKIIVFDEADAGQDYKGAMLIMNIAKELHEKGYTIIFVTHNMSLVRGYAHRLITMDKKGIISKEQIAKSKEQREESEEEERWVKFIRR